MTNKLILLLFCLTPFSLYAETMSFSYSGVVDQVFRTPTAPFESVVVGDPFEVDYTLDLSTPDQDGVDELGTFSGAVVTYTVTIGDAAATTTLGGVNTVNAGAFGSEDTYAAVGIFEDFSTSLTFTDSTGAAYAATDDLASIDLADFDDRTFTLLNGIFPAVTGTFEAATTIPEPNASTLAASCLGLLMLWRRPRCV